MTTGRTNPKWLRTYVDGLDISGVARQVGGYGVKFTDALDAAYADNVQNTLLGRGKMNCGPINAFLSPAAAPTGLHELASSGIGTRHVMIAQGILGEPTQGDPCFAWIFEQGGYEVAQSADFVAVNVTLPDASAGGILSYAKPFGFLLHGKVAETAVNTSAGVDDNGASASALGGIFAWQLFSSDGTVTLKAQDATASNLNASFADISGATSGSIDATTTPQSGMVALGSTAAVRKYIRWQLVFGTATTATFACMFIRQL